MKAGTPPEMQRHSSTVLSVGPFPPPLHGLSLNTQRFSALLASYAELRLINISPGKRGDLITYLFWGCVRAFYATYRILIAPDVTLLYHPVNASGGAWYSVLIIIAARLRGYRIIVHHRSFAYLKKWSLPHSLLLKLLRRNDLNICLCETMATALFNKYRCDAERIVISNAIHTPTSIGVQETQRAELQGRVICIGLLSNLTLEKGLLPFIKLLEKAVELELPVRGELGGPATSEAQIIISSALSRLQGKLRYWGPIEGGRKAEFLRSIDVFFFPTKHRDEAQPNVVFEAMSNGAVIFTRPIGCLGVDLKGTNAVLSDDECALIDECLRLLTCWATEPAILQELRCASRRDYAIMHQKAIHDAELTLRSVFGRIAPGK